MSLGKKLEEAGLVPSMWVGRFRFYDNSMAESFVAPLKTELLYRCNRWLTRETARIAIFEYLEGFYLEGFYNRRRLHSALGYKSPAEFEEGRMRETTAA